MNSIRRGNVTEVNEILSTTTAVATSSHQISDAMMSPPSSNLSFRRPESASSIEAPSSVPGNALIARILNKGENRESILFFAAQEKFDDQGIINLYLD